VALRRATRRNLLHQDFHNPSGRSTVPEFRNSASLGAPQLLPDGGANSLAANSREQVRARFHRDWTLGVFADRDTGHAESRGLFLNPA
jgi:hypothetical protein